MHGFTKIVIAATAGALLAGAATAPAFATGEGAPTRPTLVPRPVVTATTPGGGAAGASTCRAFTTEKQTAHDDVAKRVTTIAQLTGYLQVAGDPYGVNSSQQAALASAKTGLDALDQKIQTTCYSDRATLSADARTIFTGFRVYWLRVPQTRIIESADHLGTARQALGASATKLAGLVGDNARAKADLDAMNQALGTADSHVGNPPALGGAVVAVPGLAPAVDMTADVTALKAARQDLVAARGALDTARRAGLRVVADLGGPAAA